MNDFGNKYRHPDYPVKFRPGDKRTTLFGIDKTYDRLRWHNAIDIAGPNYETYVPFDCEEVGIIRNAGVFGTIITLKIRDADFDIRIMHFREEDIDQNFYQYFTNFEPVEAGAFIGEQKGSSGKGTGTHIHVEYVSREYRSAILDEILKDQDREAYYSPELNIEDWVEYAAKIDYNLDDAMDDYLAERSKRHIRYMGRAFCTRGDYLARYAKDRTWYNSYILFNKM